MDLSTDQEAIAQSLRRLDTALQRLIEAIAHSNGPVTVEGTDNARQARRRVCDAYGAIDYAMDDEPNTTVTCLGVIGVTPDVLRRAEALNAAKAAFKALSVPLQRIRQRVPVKGTDGPTKAIPVIRVILRHLQRSDLNLLAAYRRIPILHAPPQSVRYTRARTRAVYRKSIRDIEALLDALEGPDAAADRARLRSLPRSERALALARDHYENVRANVVYARLDAKGRGRVQLAAELPLLYAIGRSAPPDVEFPAAAHAESDAPRRTRTGQLEAEPFLASLTVYRYRQATPSRNAH